MAKKIKSKSEPLPIHDRRSIEKVSAYSQQLMKNTHFNSLEEMNTFIGNHISGQKLDDMELTPQTPLELAQAKIYDAFAAVSSKKRIALAKEALKISPDCADAYVVLAEETAKTYAEAISLYRKGMKAGRRALGEEIFKNQVGNFWSILETRPYMRALFGYAKNLWEDDDDDKEALACLRELMRLNKSDNQGVRYVLAPALIEAGKYEEAKQILQTMKDEPSACSKFSWALLLYLTEGKSITAIKALDDALKQNAYVAGALMNIELLEQVNEQIDSYEPGSLEEAVIYSWEWFPAWYNDENQSIRPMEWLMDHLDACLKKQGVLDVFPDLQPSDNAAIMRDFSRNH
jgi:tetratricopeptide (TPR) repeat protein